MIKCNHCGNDKVYHHKGVKYHQYGCLSCNFITTHRFKIIAEIKFYLGIKEK